MSNSCWVIAGSTSSIATAFAREVASRGDDIILLGRDKEKLKAQQSDLLIRYDVSVVYLEFDAINLDQHEAIAKSCNDLTTKPINLCIAFGYMPIANSLDCSFQENIQTMQVNYNAAAILALSFVPYFKSDKKNRILVFGSVAGDRGRYSNFVYGSAKAGLEQFFEGLRAALSDKNITITFMRFGYIDTPLTYGKPGYFLAASPASCAKTCLRLANRGVSAAYFPWFWRWIMLAFKLMPRFIFNKLKI